MVKLDQCKHIYNITACYTSKVYAECTEIKKNSFFFHLISERI